MSKIDELVIKIKKYSEEYYSGESSISDEEFDALVDELRELDPSNEVLTTTGWGGVSPTKLEHKYGPMGSLPKSKITPETVIETNRYYTQKYDGLTIDLVYVGGKLVQAVTRGDGRTGQDILPKMKYVVPQVLSEDITASFRGEFVISKSNFSKYYPDSPSPRNIASGVLNKKSVDPEELSRFTAVIYKLHGVSSSVEFDKIHRVIANKKLHDLGFIVPKCVVLTNGTEQSYSEVLSNLGTSDKNDYPIDGIVSSPIVSDLKVVGTESTGETMFYCDYEDELAYKVITEKATTTVERVEYSLTRTGRLVPRVWFNPINLSGARVSKATGHNAAYIRDNCIGEGAIVEVVRSGEVIPYITDVVSPVSTPDLPTNCPVCNHSTKWSGVDLVCSNPECDSVNSHKVNHWIWTMGNVDNLGNSSIETFLTTYNIMKVEDIYNVEESLTELRSANGVGDAKVNVVRDMLNMLREPKSITTYLSAFNVTGLGWTSASKLDTPEIYESLMRNDKSELEVLIQNTKGVMQKSKDALVSVLDLVISRLDIVTLVDPSKVEEESTNLDKLPICVTGKLVSYKTRKELFESLKDKVVEVGIKDAKYLVCNENKNSSKHKYATSNGIPIITESELLNMI